MFHCIYRISDKGYIKTKLENADKMRCLDSFLSEFRRDNVLVIADNCTPQTVMKLKQKKLKLVETSLGNAGSFLYAAKYAIDHFDEDDYVYLCEDDYLYKKNARDILLEGAEIADYATLYDHPDKYNDFAGNPFIKNGGEKTKVYLTNSSHWKETNSTTMTFIIKVKTLKEDFPIWKIFGNNDFLGFRILTGNFLTQDDVNFAKQMEVKKRKLISSIPGYSTHCEIQ